jgi:fructose-bisphosphate aldolase, class II
VSVPTTEQYHAMLDAAAAGAYAYPAVNVTSSQTLNAAIRGFADAGSDGIVEVTTGGGRYLSGGGDAARGARALAEFAHAVATDHDVTIALHTDHCPPDQAKAFLEPLIAESARRDRPLFNSHMFDGSTLTLEENLRRSAELLDKCAAAGVVLELEVGVVGGSEDDVAGDGGQLYTTPEDLLRVADVLGTGDRGRYLLAATFGNVHGIAAPQDVELRPEILAAGQEALAAAHPGARFQYVFHGSSGSSDADLHAAVRYGVVKVNVDSDMQFAFTRAVADHVSEHAGGLSPAAPDKAAFDPRTWGARAEQAMADCVARACETLGSAGRSLTA